MFLVAWLALGSACATPSNEPVFSVGHETARAPWSSPDVSAQPPPSSSAVSSGTSSAPPNTQPNTLPIVTSGSASGSAANSAASSASASAQHPASAGAATAIAASPHALPAERIASTQSSTPTQQPEVAPVATPAQAPAAPPTAQPAPPLRRARRAAQAGAFEREQHARELFADMSRNEKLEFIGWFEGECKQVQSFQSTLIQWVLKNAADPSTWPQVARSEWFDPEQHAPAQPIPRRWLADDDANLDGAYARFFANVPARRAESGWEYDYAAREPRRLPEEDDPDRVLRNALLGLPPGWDYAEVLVEGMLDDGSLQKNFAGFAHAYTDRYGNAYPGITLYDAWASRADMEMPDVDAVGLIHAILDDWTTWKAVVSNDDQPALYARLGELFFAAFRHRGLRNALARSFVCGSTELRDGYQNHLDRFHALWEEAQSTPAELAKKLPDSNAWASTLQAWTDEMAKDELRLLRGVRRRYVLDASAEQVRTLLFRLLDQYQLDRPAKKK